MVYFLEEASATAGLVGLLRPVFVAVALSAVTGCDFPHSIHAPAITQELPYDGDGATAFDRKVKSRFPVGSDEGAMHSELAREGFTIHQINLTDGGSPPGLRGISDHE